MDPAAVDNTCLADMADIVVAVDDLPFLVVDQEQIVVAAYHC